MAIYFIDHKMQGWAFVMSGLNVILTQVAIFTLMSLTSLIFILMEPARRSRSVQRL